MGIIINPYRFDAGGYDADAQAFIDAVGSLTTTEEEAINDLVLDMKSASVWSKGHVYYPMVGGTASEHKWNLFDPRDLDAAFRGTFGGGWTHNADGAKGNGTTGYIDTHLAPYSAMTENSTTFIYSSGTTTGDAGALIGCIGSSFKPYFVLHSRYTDNRAYSDQYNYSTGRIATSNTNGSGVYTGSRTTSAVHKLYKNGSQIGATNTGTPFDVGKTWANLTGNIAVNSVKEIGTSTFSAFSPKLCQGVGIFDGLSDTNVSDLTTAIDDFNTALSR